MSGLTVLERLALGLAGVVGLTLLLVGAGVALVREGRARGAERRQREELEADELRRSHADAVRGRPLPTQDEADAWDRLDS